MPVTVVRLLIYVAVFAVFSVVKSVEQFSTLSSWLNDSSNNRYIGCSPHRHKEWNEVVQIRYDSAKKKAGLLPEDCLVSADGQKPRKYWAVSGQGSTLATTEPLRNLLKDLFHDPSYNIKSFFDAPCGDWVWMQHVDLTGISYIGGDITTVTINENNKCFNRPNVHFVPFDLTCAIAPPVDLMLTRDVLFHLKDEIVLQILQNINKSKVRYFLTTTFLTNNTMNPFAVKSYQETVKKRGDSGTIGYRNINVMDKPFCLPPPILKIKENAAGDRYIGLWKVPFTVGSC